MRWLTLLLTLQQALWVDVPFIQQPKDGCGAASIWMVLEYWKPGSAASVSDIQGQLYSSAAGGIYAQDMAHYFEAHGYRVFTFRGDWTDLEHHVSKGRPLIVSLERNARGVPLHYVVVAGIDSVQNLVLVNDPAQRKLLSLSRADFESSWRATENWTLLAVPELDLATEAFRENRLSEARDHLASALRLNAADTYTNDFLATVHFLQNNDEAALKYWNRAGKPAIENIRIDPPLQLDPVLLDRAFSFSRGSILQLSDFQATEARLNSLHVFSRYRLELSPDNDESFNVTLRAAERSGANWLSWIRGLPFQSVRPQYSNLHGKAINAASLLRWDAEKRRAFVYIESPLKGDPKWGIQATLDARNENWFSPTRGFRMQKTEGSLQIRSVPSARWSWQTGAAISNRQFSNSLPDGVALKYFASSTRTFVRDPVRLFKLDSTVRIEAGKLFSGDQTRFATVSGGLSMRWRDLTSELRLGHVFGRQPFDEGFVLGVERDSDFYLRGHAATVDGQKNAANAVQAFVLTNSDFQRKVWDSGWFDLSAGPFLDTAKSAMSPKWLMDAGIEARFSILHILGFTFSYGAGLKDGQHASFFRESR